MFSPVIVELLIIVDKSQQTDESAITRGDCIYFYSYMKIFFKELNLSYDFENWKPTYF